MKKTLVKIAMASAVLGAMTACSTEASNNNPTNTTVANSAVATQATMVDGYVAIGQAQSQITVADIEEAQQAWANGLMNIGKVYRAGGDYKQTAQQFISKMYAFDQNNGRILFKPTLASEKPFRATQDSALSYFVGGELAEDEGFAIKPWTAVKFNNDEMFIRGDFAVVMGQYTFTYDNQKDILVEYTFVYKKVGNDLKIVTQHSSLPFNP